MNKLTTFYLLTILIFSFSGIAQAVPTTVTYIDGRQDPLWVPPFVHELGTNAAGAAFFPPNELISAIDTLIEYQPCPVDYEPGGPPNFVVSITNLTGTAWTDVWYVADPETTLTNDDGWINSELAFKIDNIGVNKPLVFESMTPNLIFEPGETWDFVIQNYSNVFGLAPSALSSVGVPSPGEPVLSSGSIIAIPAPGAILLGGIGVGLVGWLRKRRTL